MRSVLIGEVDQSLACYASDLSLARRGEPELLLDDQEKFARWLLSDEQISRARLEAIRKFCGHPKAPQDLVAEVITAMIFLLQEDFWRSRIRKNSAFQKRLFNIPTEIRQNFCQEKTQPILILIDLALYQEK